MREFSREVPGDQRQIISKNSIPVRIAKNPEASAHRDRVSLGVGGMMEMGKIQEPILQEEAHLQRQIQELQERLQNDAYARVRATHPNATLAYDDYPLTAAMMKRILTEEPERQEEIDEAKALVATITKKRYQFHAPGSSELYVGKEGTLVYSLQTGERTSNELRKAVVWKKDEHGIGYHDPEWAVKINALRERIQKTRHVADIHQVEVLPEYQGKGLAKALLDVALWDIEHAKDDVAFSVARVISDNPDGEKMITAFKKAGFDAFAVRVDWPDRVDFTLLVRENPYFQGTE